ncbi:MAG: hypothetical protein P1S60_16195, partial [Anaerolineae bacterium]|nr:hypothetical protein [Anaerolineae bacterium]
SPVHYSLEIDSKTQVVLGNRVELPMTNGVHAWRVAAVDAAGNHGLWTPFRWFVIDTRVVHLPLVLR